MKKILMIVTLLMTTMTLYAETDVNKILTVIEEQMALKTDMKAKVKLTQQKVKQGLKILEVTYYRRDSDDSFIMVTTAPESENGNGYLRIGENFWMYKRNTRTFQHINRDESIGGTNAKSGDFEKRKLTELYKPAGEIKEEMLGKTPVYRFDILAKVNDVEYPKKTYWVRKDNYLPLKIQSFSLSGTLMESSYFIKYTVVEGRYIAVKQFIVDEFEKGNKTEVDISSISTEKIDDSVFTKAYLENLTLT